MRVITFSRQFPGYHPRKGEQTFFVEKILNQLGIDYRNILYKDMLFDLNKEKLKDKKLTDFHLLDFFGSLERSITDCKPHTIRSRDSRKQGQFFHPVVWSGRPRFDPQIIFAPPTEIKKLWKFEIKDSMMRIDNQDIVIVEYRELIARHDGLTYQGFKDWFKFPKPFSGQVICWNENVNY